MARYLTKSRFKLAAECPTKLFYTGKSDIYPDQNDDNSFLSFLAGGGFQVGELAKLYHPGGIDITETKHEQALERTAQLLQEDNVTLFEPAFCFENLFIRIDVLVKRGHEIEMIEVKSKSCSGSDPSQFLTKKGLPNSKWRPYLLDAAFQKYVLEQAHPEFRVSAFLMLADKSSTCPSDGLHQKFRLDMNARGRRSVTVTDQLSDSELQQSILTKVPVNEIVGDILEATTYGTENGLRFPDWVRELSTKYARDEKIPSEIGNKCGTCSFRANDDDKQQGKKSGFEECWRERLGWKADAFQSPTVLELGGSRRTDKYLAEGKNHLTDLQMSDVDFEGTSGATITTKERQWLQIDAANTGTRQFQLRRDALRRAIEKWTYPLHFIDFETAAPAVPFHAGQRPYEQLAFQFSHHVVHEDGGVEHAGEHLNTAIGAFPNFEFVRALQNELMHDEGTVLRYAPHENTILAAIHAQLMRSSEADRLDLCEFIESVSHPTSSTTKGWRKPPRDMIDLWDLVKAHYFDPAMGGSTSIKKVLPAVLNSSDYLQAKYSAPIYGAAGGIGSHNFSNHIWVQRDETARVRDPYELLPTLFREPDLALEERLMSSDDELREGGAAMAAYARMQFTEMSAFEREALSKGLRRYCELDTLAMVMIFEGWREWLK